MNNIHGIFAIMLSHFNHNDRTNYDTLSKYVQWLQSDVHDIMPVDAK